MECHKRPFVFGSSVSYQAGQEVVGSSVDGDSGRGGGGSLRFGRLRVRVDSGGDTQVAFAVGGGR